MPTPLTISFCRLALLPTEATLADGAESVLLQLQWINSPCTNLSTMRVPALRPRFQGRCVTATDNRQLTTTNMEYITEAGKSFSGNGQYHSC